MPAPQDSPGPTTPAPALLESMLAAQTLGLAALDASGRILYANPALEDLLDAGSGGLAGRFFHDLGPGAEAADDPENPGPFHARLKGPGGCCEVFLEVRDLPPGAEHDGVRLVLVRTPLERLAEDRLRRGQALARVLLDAEDDAALLLDVDGQVVAVNRSGAARFRATPEEMIGRSLAEFLPWDLFEARLGRVMEVFCQGRGLRFEDERDGRWLEHSFWPVLGRDGGVALVAAFARDVTEQHALARLREDVERIARHDIKSPLTGIVGLARALLRDENLSARQKALVEAMGEAGEQVLALLNTSLDLLAMERGEYRPPQEILDLSEILGRVESRLDPLIRRKRLSLAYLRQGRPWPASEPCPLRGDPRHLETLFANLLKNAFEAAPSGSRISVSLEPLDGFWEVAVHNEGCVPEPVRGRFFEKYSTAGKPGGTGLGTYSARLIARAHGGDVAMETSETEGTRVRVRLPRSPDAGA